MRVPLTCALLFPVSLLGAARAPTTPQLQLANDYRADIQLSGYWVSEKYDGIRAFWTGDRLITRTGHIISAPAWFTADWPAIALDGELWIGRGQFELTSATVRDAVPDDDAWRQVRFMVFDLPAHPGQFAARLSELQRLLGASVAASLRVVPQWQVGHESDLLAQLDREVAAGAEGLMLHRGDSYYHGERSDDLMKLKPHQDAEARVVGYVPGKGKYTGMMGALRVARPDGLEFALGTGFTDEDRRRPPRIGDSVTYSFHGVTARGVPRFARFMRRAPPG
jgi:DNA ligase-1